MGLNGIFIAWKKVGISNPNPGTKLEHFSNPKVLKPENGTQEESDRFQYSGPIQNPNPGNP